MRTLITYASKHGSTREIAEVMAGELRRTGIEVDLYAADDVDQLDGYDALIIGSAIYMGQWQAAALHLIDSHIDELAAKPVWLFSSGPIGADPFPAGEPPITGELLTKTGAREHQSFAGRLEKSSLGFGERLVTSVVRAPEGDFRDWDAILAWIRSIAQTILEAEKAVSSST